MADWTNGYIADIGYTYGYYHALNPLRANLALLHARVAPPESGTACELGYGQGISANIHAAASATSWHGTDFNPGQAGFARQLAANLADGPALYDQSFAEFCAAPTCRISTISACTVSGAGSRMTTAPSSSISCGAS